MREVDGKVHGYHRRTVADVPVDDRPVVVSLRVRRLPCPELDCPRRTFRERVPGLLAVPVSCSTALRLLRRILLPRPASRE